MEIALIGNTSVDNVIDMDTRKSFTRLGGVVNVARALPEACPYIRLGNSLDGQNAAKYLLQEKFKEFHVNFFGETNTSEIAILKDGKTKELLGKSWKKEVLKPIQGNFDWIHISYLNECMYSSEDLRSIRASTKFLSADLCQNIQGYMPWLKDCWAFDFLFFSKDEYDIQEQENTALVKHSKDLCEYRSKELSFNCVRAKESEISNVHILGAGDYFVANFIRSFMYKNDRLLACQNAMHRTPNTILTLNG